MGTPAFNLVIVKGAKEDLDAFEKVAYKNESEAFCMEQLLPLPTYLSKEEEISDEVQAFRHTVYGCNWVAAFGILIEKSDFFLKYYFNSKDFKAQLDYIAIKYNNLKFTQVFVETFEEKCGAIEYGNGERISEIKLEDQEIDWKIASNISTYLYIAELFHKLMLINKTKPNVFNKLSNWQKYSFFKFFNKINYLREHENFYDSLYFVERELEKRELDYARNGTAYPFRTNSPLSQLMFIDQNYLPSDKKTNYALAILNQITNSTSLDDHEKLDVYIYIHQNMDMEELLMPIARKFIHDRIENMKLYLHQRDQSFTMKMEDLQSRVVLTHLFQYETKEIEFLDWPGLEKEQALFHEWLEKAMAVKKSLEPMQSEIEDNDLPF